MTTERPLPRVGYPLIESPEHPLWEAQQNGWPDIPSHEAWRQRVELETVGRTDSRNHPAFQPGFVEGQPAPEEEPQEPATPPVDVPRR